MSLSLKDPVARIPLVGPSYSKKLERLGVFTVEDLITHIPRRYLDFRKSAKISELRPGDTVYLKGEVVSSISQYTKKGGRIQITQITDGEETVLAIWFNQPFLSRILYPGVKLSIAGEVGWFNRKLAFLSPEYEKLDRGIKTLHTQGLVPIYPETARVSSKWIRRRITDVIENISYLEDFLPQESLKEYDLFPYWDAIKKIHAPKNGTEIDLARKRLAFNELLFLHLNNLRKKKRWSERKIKDKLSINNSLVQEFIKQLPFELTNSQIQAVDEIIIDLLKDKPMNRLLEGDVGSGKTVVAGIAAYAVFLGGMKTLVMAPTQILAMQHKETFRKILPKDVGINVGTHSLLYSKTNFKNVGLIIIDEQHRFGVAQREVLVKKTGTPHVLTMTATPIPRTVAMTFYGDLDISTLTELPKNRIPVTTWILGEQKRNGAYKWVNEEIEKNKSQVFVICPLIDESEVETIKEVKAAKVEFERLKKIFKNRKLGLLHGRVKAKEKDEILGRFRNGKIDILVATPIVEVGIDIPNATIMVIEAAERYGLAQLHQLRGRVGRGNKKSYCLLFTENSSEKTLARLKALKLAKTGHDLAEMDLVIRGPGEIFGTRQSGFPELKIARWSDIDLIKDTRKLALEMVKYPYGAGTQEKTHQK